MAPVDVVTCAIRRRLFAGMICVAGVLATACTPALPEVTFFGNRTTTAAGPSLWCSVDATASTAHCPVDRAEAGAGQLFLRPGQGVEISVPSEVGDQPWTVVFRYHDAAGTHDARSAVFAAGSRLAYVLSAPTPDATIDRVEVQSGLTLVEGADGGVDVAVLRTWVLLVGPAAARSSGIER